MMRLTETTVALVAAVFFNHSSTLLLRPPPSADCARVRANCHFQAGSHHRQEGQGTRYALPDSNGPMLCVAFFIIDLLYGDTECKGGTRGLNRDGLIIYEHSSLL